ncbi:MAG: FAD-binding oxidoreductase [Burkholderiales bacterium]|jgi:glycine/D-amino acid oxidase-like deaminating enzyme|nr:FAD-binding oxidoreductase [Burkholderiales bacterium]
MSYDVVIVGAGFYGCCLALYLKANGYSVLVLEKEKSILSRASAINQARVHTGFHYPRSLATAIRSLINMPRFVFEFRHAIVDDFTMLYAIARQGSKVNAKRFHHMFKKMGGPIKEAQKHHKALFDPGMVEDVFETKEYAFDHAILAKLLGERMAFSGVDVLLETEAFSCVSKADHLVVDIPNGKIKANHVFNCTYSRINLFLDKSGVPLVALKHEITEMALVSPPEILSGLAVTVMDGPFFSLMPYPSRNAYTLSHVRYTPHQSWIDNQPIPDAHRVLSSHPQSSRFHFMDRDVKRFMPELELKQEDSLFEVKTVLVKNELDDGRPIFYRQHLELGNLYTVMGSKIDNVYDLFEGMNSITAPFSEAVQGSRWRAILGLGT